MYGRLGPPLFGFVQHEEKLHFLDIFSIRFCAEPAGNIEILRETNDFGELSV